MDDINDFDVGVLDNFVVDGDFIPDLKMGKWFSGLFKSSVIARDCLLPNRETFGFPQPTRTP